MPNHDLVLTVEYVSALDRSDRLHRGPRQLGRWGFISNHLARFLPAKSLGAGASVRKFILTLIVMLF